MHPLRLIAILLFAGILIPIPAGSRQASQSAPAASAPNSAPVETSTVLQANANLVLLDVVVTDHDRAVHGLDRSRFHIFEDGKEQTITSFDEHQAPAAPSSSVMQSPTRAALPPNTFTNAPAFPNAGAVNVLLLDGLNTPQVDQLNVRRRMLEYLSTIKPGTTLAIFTLSSGFHIVQGFTGDVSQLTEALKSSKANAQSPILISEGGAGLAASAANLAKSDGASPAIMDQVVTMLQFAADEKVYDTDLRVQMTVDAMQQLTRYLSAVPGRKNLIWFSAAFPIVLDPDSGNPQDNPSIGSRDYVGGPFKNMRNYADAVRETSDLLSAARVLKRSEERRVGKECTMTCRSRWSPYH